MFLRDVVDAIWARVDSPAGPLAIDGRTREVQGGDRSGESRLRGDCEALTGGYQSLCAPFTFTDMPRVHDGTRSFSANREGCAGFTVSTLVVCFRIERLLLDHDGAVRRAATSRRKARRG